MAPHAYNRFAPLSVNLVTSELGNAVNSSCPDGIQWLWVVLGDCAVTTREQVSAYIGLFSMLVWIVVTVPQIIKNMRNIDGMSGVSFFLLFQWTGGDVTNLVGAILTNQLKPQIILACYFVVTDVVLLFEYLVFFIRKRRRTKENENAITTAPRAVLCLMGFVSLTHCLTGFFSSPSTSGFEAWQQNRHASRYLLSEDSRNALLFRSEDYSSSGEAHDFTSQSASSPFWHNTVDIVGYVIGCLSSVFYVGSRLAQIYTNYKNQSTDGLAIMTFILAVVGNAAYGAQILVQSLEEEFLLEHTPWLIGSLGVIALDSTLLWQFYHYAKSDGQPDEEREALINEQRVIPVNDSIHSVSQGQNGFSASLY